MTRAMQNLKLIRHEENLDTGMVSVVLNVCRQGQGPIEITFSRADLAEVRKVKETILNRGGVLTADLKDHLDRLLDEVPSAKHKVTQRSGWYGDGLVTRYGEFNDEDHEVEYWFDRTSPSFVKRLKKGKLKGYIKALERPLSKSNYLVFALAAALAPALADRIGRPNGYGFNFSGVSSTGKTLSLRVCLSAVSRAHDTDLTSFNDTTGYLLEQLPTFGVLAVPFTDLKATREKGRDLCHKLQTIVFGAHDGAQRRQMKSGAKPQPRFFISLFNSEQPLAEIFAKAGVPFEGGDAVRLIDIPVPDATGIFDLLQESDNASEYAAETENAIAEDYGVLFPEWVAHLSGRPIGKLKSLVDELEKRFLDALAPLNPLERRMAKSFAMVAIAGHIAATQGLLPVPPGRLPTCCLELFQRARERLHAKDLRSRKEFEGFIEHVTSPNSFPTVQVGNEARPQECESGFRRLERGTTFLYVKAHHVERFFSEKSSLYGNHLPSLERKGAFLRPKNGWTAPIQQAGLDRERYMKFNLDLLLKPRLER